MERIDGINPNRIEWCLHDAGITADQLARDLGIAETTLPLVLAGERGLTYGQLKKLGKYFGRTALFFLEPGEVVPTQVRSAAFRTLSNQKRDLDKSVKKVIELAEWHREAYLGLLGDLERNEETRFSPPDVQGLSAEAAARAARSWLQITATRCFADYRQAIEAKGVLVFRTNGYAGKWQLPKENSVLGFSIYKERLPVILVKKQRSETSQTFTLAHELGHLLMHRTSMIDDEADFSSNGALEVQANQFAGFFLVPTEDLAEISIRDQPADVSEFDNWLAPYRKAWGASTEVILLRLMSIGGMTQNSFGAYKQWMASQRFGDEATGSRMYRYREPKHILGEGYVRTVLDALDAKKLSLVRASKYLDDIKLNDIRKLERHYADV